MIIALSLFLMNSAHAEQTEGIQTNPSAAVKDIDLLPAMASVSSSPNRIWVGTFQLVWNELIDEYVKKPVKFAGYNSDNVKLLNKRTFSKNNIHPDAYYIKSGPVSPELKEEIENGIKEKFNETSDILDSFDWSEDEQKLFIYAMLKKDFKFLVSFDKLPDNYFGSSRTPVPYFGINNSSWYRLRKNVVVMFYNSDNDFAVKLLTRGRDTVILYRTDDDTTFDEYYENLDEKYKAYKGTRRFTGTDSITIPDLSLYIESGFPEFEGHRIKGTNMQIDKTIETVDFKMNKNGVKLKSEAAIMARCTALLPDNGRHFNYTDNYVMFLVEKNKTSPYFAMRVHDVETLNKTGRK